MLLIDLLEVIDEGNNIKIVEYLTYEEIAEYDGRNSIDEKYNLLPVVSIYSSIKDGKDWIEIVVNNGV